MRLDVSLFSVPALAVAVGGLVMGIALVVGGAGSVSRVEGLRADPRVWPAIHAPVQVPEGVPAMVPLPAA
ncbi:MAG: hypothetical protein M9937_13550 [Chelatococcus sp.]|nr:hypothetical protein [Chelatococcus sp.]CAH1673841.1 conserved hypothetical protein [Hyphomicrobiales bacterium]CAH1673916.1 conserved hypothetical protein [Hyphomicrobiales bacterium]